MGARLSDLAPLCPARPGVAASAGAVAAAEHLRHRVQALEARFGHIAISRMRGLPVCHPGLHVQALGFELPQPAAHAGPGHPGAVSAQVAACGVLITPWFMNLVRLPWRPLAGAVATEAGWLAPGVSAARRWGSHRLDFVGALEGEGDAEGLGAFELSSLFSPMFQFTDHAAAHATALEVLKLLGSPEAPPAESALATGRRSFLFGRRPAQEHAP